MDFETVLPIKTVNDIVKEIKENEADSCDCENCDCSNK